MVILTTTPTGFDAILGQSTNLTTLVGDVFTILTGNAYLAFFALVGVVAAAIHVFRLIRGASKG